MRRAGTARGTRVCFVDGYTARPARPLAVRAISSCTVSLAAGRVPRVTTKRSIQCGKVLLRQCGPSAGG